MRSASQLIYFLVVVLGMVYFSACKNDRLSDTAQAVLNDTVKSDDEIVMAILYQQKAAEYQALCLQTYNLAGLRVAEAIRDAKTYSAKPFAVVTDLDETALDNSKNEAWSYLHDSAFSPVEFDDWSVHGQAGSVPGSVAFFNYVDGLRDRRGRKIAIYYISNRRDTLPVVDSTISQMRRLHFPQLVDSQFLFQPKGASSSKEARRQRITGSHKIILLLGDNLIDLTAVFDGTASDPQNRSRMVDSLKEDWGKKYIVFPNAEYGDWEKALYPDGKYPHTLGEERKYRRQALDSLHF